MTDIEGMFHRGHHCVCRIDHNEFGPNDCRHIATLVKAAKQLVLLE